MALWFSRRVCCFLFFVLASRPLCVVCADCPPQWHVNSSSVCPYGHQFIFGDVTVPKELTVPLGTCVLYGIIPFIVIGASILDCTCRSVKNRGIGTREASFLSFVLVIVALNELVFKSLARQQRPIGSCLMSCGFPSGHSVMAVGFFIHMWLDASFRVMPKVPLTVDAAQVEARVMQGRRRRGRSFMGLTAREWLMADLRAWTLMPLTASDILTSWDYVNCISMWALLLTPVPVSRVILHDHTIEQIISGSIVGTIEAMVWFSCVRHFFLRRCNHLLGQRMGYIFIHNYPLPRFEVRSRCCRALVRQSLVPHERAAVLGRLMDELEWYLQQPHIGRVANMAQTDEDAVFWEMEAHNLRPLQHALATELHSLQLTSRTSNSSALESMHVSVLSGD